MIQLRFRISRTTKDGMTAKACTLLEGNEGKQIADTEKRGNLNVGDQSSGDGTVRPSIRAWEAVSSLERRLGTTTGMGQTNRLALASRESPGIIHGYPRSFAIHQRRAYALVLQLCNSLTDALVAVCEIEQTVSEPAIPDQQHQPCCFIAGPIISSASLSVL
ncbi:hypothetical protein HN011_011228 [Eciton burchellii]|nr:hypothetical protein HN011_011228 [Eciton burchellii]